MERKLAVDYQNDSSHEKLKKSHYPVASISLGPAYAGDRGTHETIVYEGRGEGDAECITSVVTIHSLPARCSEVRRRAM